MCRRRALLLLVLTVAVTAGCRRETYWDRAHVAYFEPPATKPEAEFVAAHERFACRLLQALWAEQPDRNLFFSPVSLNLALGMLANGARGQTLTAIQRALAWQKLPLAEANRNSRLLLESLQFPDGSPVVSLANSLWLDPQCALRPEFARTVGGDYDATVRSLSLSPPDAAAAEINRWASEQTRQMIPEVITAQDLQQVRLVLANALYFEGKWQWPFLKRKTRRAAFHLLSGTEKRVPFMSQGGEYLYLEQPQFQAVTLPYRHGRVSFDVFLPTPQTTLAAFLGTVTAENWARWHQGFTERTGEVKLPRFKADFGSRLKPALTALGMGAAFDPRQANLSGLGAPAAEAGEVVHRAVVEVDEQGTRAAAVSALPPPAGPGPPPTSNFTMVVDRPFLCAIRDNGTGALLFLGVVVNPGELAK